MDEVEVVPDGSLAPIPIVPVDGTLVQEFKTGHLFLIERGRRLQLTEEQFRSTGRPREEIVGVPWGVLGAIPFAGPYRRWKTGFLRRFALPIAVTTRSAWAIALKARAVEFAVGVVAGLFLYWLIGA